MKLSKLTPNLAVVDIRQSVEFYCKNLGFNLVMAVPLAQRDIDDQLADGKEYVYALLQKDGVELMFQRFDSFAEDLVITEQRTIGASVSFYMEGRGLEAFHAELNSRGVKTTEVKLTWYGVKEFYLADNNGYILGFAEETAQAEA